MANALERQSALYQTFLNNVVVNPLLRTLSPIPYFVITPNTSDGSNINDILTRKDDFVIRAERAQEDLADVARQLPKLKDKVVHYPKGMFPRRPIPKPR
jgi:hypothetical protein